MHFGLLGEHLGHSYSPELHHALADYPYDRYEVPPENLSAFLTHGNWDGLNVTIPYKQSVIPHCAALSETARAIGSVNTLLRRADGTLFGDNTDAVGFAGLLADSGLSLKDKKIVVLGSGGASLTVCHVLQAHTSNIVVISRRGENHYGNLHLHRDAQILVNTTPVGMYPACGVSPVSLSAFPACEGVFDLIYNPARTALLLEAEARGIPAHNGLFMLAGQAKRAAELFTGTPIDEGRILACVKQLRRQMENLILIGMPGCGKSTVGQALAAQLGRPFVDADTAVEEAAGCSIPDLFAQRGEAGFREIETAVLARLGQQSGLVIATGGGCVTRPENKPLLYQNGRIIFLERPLSDLSREGRPLSSGGNLDAMYAARLPLYRQFAEITLRNDAAPEAVAAEIWRCFT